MGSKDASYIILLFDTTSVQTVKLRMKIKTYLFNLTHLKNIYNDQIVNIINDPRGSMYDKLDYYPRCDKYEIIHNWVRCQFEKYKELIYKDAT